MPMFDKTLVNKEYCQEFPILLEHLKAVLEYNEVINLTSIQTLEAGKVLHIQDSLAALSELDKAPPGRFADLGSGAGYPGIPLAVVSNRSTTLIESNQKKARFLKSFIDSHGLTDRIEVHAGRSEELALKEPNGFSVITARAVAELPVLVELAAPLLSLGGQLIAYKGKPEDSENERANLTAERLSLTLMSSRSYCLNYDNTCYNRQIIVYQKTQQSSFKLPRRPGMANKRPLA